MDPLPSDLAKQEVNDLINSFGLLKCKGSKPIKLICLEVHCKNSSLHCQSVQCQNCSQNHPLCSTIHLQKWLTVIKKKAEHANQCLIKFLELQKDFIKKMSELKKQLSRPNFLSWIPKQLQIIFTKVFLQSKIDLLRGWQAHKITEVMKKASINEKEVFYKFEKKSKQIVQNYQQLKQMSINNLLGTSPLNSHIIQTREDCKQLHQWLKNPVKFELLFRASQHKFSSVKFHQLCDNTANTLVIIKTQFGKIIGGYTPLTWNSANKTFSKDSSFETFIFSLNLKKKMHLLNQHDAIYCAGDSGPAFGKGNDIYISNGCNKNKLSLTNFPYSYNHHHGYKNSQQTYTAFNGTKVGYYFTVLQYEVFKVIWK